MTSDRELLEAAARAAGYKVRAVAGYEEGGTVTFYMEPSQLYWDPLLDDGDALRLAVKLRMTITVQEWSDGWYVFENAHCVEAEPLAGDPYAATRRAIVRAAAASA